MDYNYFIESFKKEHPTDDILNELKALWYEAKGNWNLAHEIVQELTTKNAAWVHAYLHRKEPDEWNASYWYSRAGKAKPNDSLENEWKEIVRELLR